MESCMNSTIPTGIAVVSIAFLIQTFTNIIQKQGKEKNWEKGTRKETEKSN